MQSRRTLVLLCAAPLILMGMGCSSRALRSVSRVSPPTGAATSSYSARMMQLADRYERQGNREGALRLYRQILEADPDHARAQARIAAIVAARVNSSESHDETTIVSHSSATSPTPTEAPVSAMPPQSVAVASPTHEVATPQPTAPWIPEFESTPVDEALESGDDAAFAEWARASEARTPAPGNEPAPGRDIATGIRPGWDAEITPQTDSTPIAWDAAEIDSSEPAWTRTSLVRLCPNAGGNLRLILQRLDRDDPEVQKQALMELSDLGGDGAAALTAARVLLNASDESVRAHAAWAAWSIGGGKDRSVSTLASLSQSQRDDVVQVAAFFLGSMGEDARNATGALREARERASGATRLYLAEALVRIDSQDVQSLNELTRALHDRDAELRWLAAVALANTSPEQASWIVPVLATRLDDSDTGVCSAVALTLGSLGPAARSAIGPLELATAHEAPDVRDAAMAALACIQRE